MGKNIFRVYYINKDLSRPFRSHRGAGWGGFKQVHLDDVDGHLLYWEAPSVLILGWPPRCWARLAGVLNGKNIYSGSTMLIKNYPALSAAIGGWDRVDGRRCSWMRLVCTFLFGKHQFLGGEVDSIGSFLLISYSFWMFLDALERCKS